MKQFVRIRGTRGACQTSSFGDGGHDRGSLGPKWSLEAVPFWLKKPCLRGVLRHILGLQSHRSGCKIRLDQFVWINVTKGIYHTPRIDSWGHGARSVGTKQSLEGVHFCRKSDVQGKCSDLFLASNVNQVTVILGWINSLGSMEPLGHARHRSLVMGVMSNDH